MIVIDLSSHKFNPVYAQTCLFKGNLHTENESVQSVASRERRKQIGLLLTLITQNSILRMHKRVHIRAYNFRRENASVESGQSGERKKKKLILCVHKCVHSRATYQLRMYQFKV